MREVVSACVYVCVRERESVCVCIGLMRRGLYWVLEGLMSTV
jgi:hypothetical protein